MLAWYTYCKALSEGRANNEVEIMAGSLCVEHVRVWAKTGAVMCYMEGFETGIGS